MASDLIGNATIGLMEHLSHYGRGWKLKGRDSEFPVVNPHMQPSLHLSVEDYLRTSNQPT
jgi:hypothetical protein